MGKLNFKIFVCILFISGCSQKIAAEYSEESNAGTTDEVDDTNHFDYPDPVSKSSG